MKLKPNRAYTYCITAILAIGLLGCTQRPAPEPGFDIESFISSLPVDSPDVVATRIIAKSQSQRQYYMYQSILYRIIDTKPANIVLQHLQHFEKTCAGDSSAQAFVKMMRGELYISVSKFDSAALELQASLALFHTLKSNKFEGDVLRKMGMLYHRQGDFEKATTYLYQGIQCYGNSIDQDTTNQLYCLHDLAVNYHLQGNEERAKSTFLQTLQLAEQVQNSYMLVQGQLGLAVVYNAIKQPDSAIVFAQRALQLIPLINDMDKQPKGYAYRWLGKAYYLKGNWTTSLQFLSKADSIYHSLNAESMQVAIWLDQANCYRELKKFQASTLLLNKIITHPYCKNNFPFQVKTVEGWALLCEAMNQPKKALELIRTAKSLTDSLNIREKAKTVEQLNFKFETAQQENRMQLLQQSNKIALLRMMVILAVLSIFVVALLFTGYQMRVRQRLLIAKNQVLLEREQSAQEKIKAYQKQLELYTQNLLQKKRLMVDYDHILQLDYMDKFVEQLEKEGKNTPMENMKILTEQDWQTYLQYFDQAYQGFISKVQTQFTNLTPAELRLFLLLKQEYDTKEIADLLGISVSGAKKTRYRLRKKIGLEETEALDLYIQQF